MDADRGDIFVLAVIIFFVLLIGAAIRNTSVRYTRSVACVRQGGIPVKIGFGRVVCVKGNFTVTEMP